MTTALNSLNCFADCFVQASGEELTKVAIIKHLGNGKWQVQSKKGKNLGTYDTKEEAKKRLQQVEYFKYIKKAELDEEIVNDKNYSATMRDLNKNEKEDKVLQFQKTYKDTFDKEYSDGNLNPEEKAYDSAINAIAETSYDDLLIKSANAIDMGDAAYAGKYLSELIRFLTKRISPESRQKSIENLRKKIYYLNEYQLASKHAPASSSLGQAITILKHILIEQNPTYIRQVLNSVVRNLG